MRWFVSLSVLLLCASTAHASPYDVYGASPRSAAMGGAQTATADGPEALHYNPGQLALSTPGVAVGIMSTFGNARILLKDRPDGYDVPDLGPPVESLGSDQTLQSRSDTELNGPLVGLNIGAVTPVIFEGLHAGFSIFLPLPTPVTLDTYFADERERYFSNQLHFERIGPKIHQLDIEFGLGYQVTDWLSVGVGAAYLPGFGVNTGIYLPDATDQEEADINAEIETENGWGLLAGTTVSLPGDISVGASFRDSTALRLSTSNELQLNGVTAGEPVLQQATWTPIFSPARVRLGVQWAPGDWAFDADVRYTLWSGYEDSQSDETNFRNVFSGAMGMEFAYTERTKLRGGIGYQPSPIPAQTGRTNYVDNDRLHVSLGAGHGFQWGETEVEVAWYLRFQSLLRRETIKAQRDGYPDCGPNTDLLCDEVPDDLADPQTGKPFPEARGLQTGNPGFPGFVAGGWNGSLGAELRY